MAREYTGRIEQRFVTTRPANERKPDRAAIDGTGGYGHLRQSGQAGDAGQTHYPRTKVFQIGCRGGSERRDRRRGRQYKNGTRNGDLPDILAPFSVDEAACVDLRFCHGCSECHAFANTGAHFWLNLGNEITEGLPRLVGLDDAERFAPGIETVRSDAAVDDRRQIIGQRP